MGANQQVQMRVGNRGDDHGPAGIYDVIAIINAREHVQRMRSGRQQNDANVPDIFPAIPRRRRNAIIIEVDPEVIVISDSEEEDAHPAWERA